MSAAERYMRKAEEALEDTQILLSVESIAGACNRAYYTMFDAAHAALASLPESAAITPIKSHRALIGTFGLQLVKTGRIDAESGRLLNEVEHIRMQADYTDEDVKPERAAWAVDQANKFVKTIRDDFFPVQSRGMRP